MREDQNAPVQVQHPLEFLEYIENQAAREREELLRDSPRPWAELLAEYVDALSELIAQGHKFNSPPEMYTLDEGHAGGCG
ncbi:DUF6269 family protein [Streptomyces sp. NPDC048751]|uniref:DUF6269 family protein n=1 Tax=Streptomyces sp. NPDC048751 TaxID=3365591 RepID=UPI00370F7F44